ncbi:MAG: DUF3592 domain-containing protein [Aliiglaciecola sp.]|uniref:DUF3592 domain-containing protein n=1 Tax=Aliiglaciecola sp. TaxID=1872441 RepID=UPI0032990614
MWQLAVGGDKQGILFYVVVYLLIVCLYSFIWQVFVRQWPSARGVLKTASVNKWGSHLPIVSEQEYKVDSLYEYHVANKHYRGTRVSPWIIIASHNAKMILNKQLDKIQTNNDGSVNVFYNPKAPQKSYLVKPGLFGLAVTLACAVVPLLLYIIEYY